MSNIIKAIFQHPSGIPAIRREGVTPLVRVIELRIGGDSFGGWGPRLL